MFEITYNDKERLNDYIGYGVAYSNGIYDFTFEDTYLVYHCEHNNQVKYIALDMRNGLDSSIITKNATRKYTIDSYSLMIPHLLYSIKYNGDRRYLQRIIDDPLDIIDTIFRIILAKNGYSIREEQIALCKKMFIGFTQKKVSLCEAEVGTGKTLSYLVAGFVARLHKYHKSNVLQPVTITTSSIELQRSIVNKEIPRLSALLQKYNIIDKPLTAVVRKGKSHYFCIRRFRNHIEQLKRHKDDYSIAISLLSEMEKLSHGIDLDNYKLGNGIKDCICVKDSCKNCGMRSFCGYYSYMTKINSSIGLDFQVTNHNLFMMNEKMKISEKTKLLRSSNFVVIDEAHKLKSATEDIYTERIDESMIENYVKEFRFQNRVEKKNKKINSLLNELLSLNKSLFIDLEDMRLDKDIDEEKGSVIKLSKFQIGKISKVLDIITDIQQSQIRSNTHSLETILVNILKALKQDQSYVIWLDNDIYGTLFLCATPKNINSVLNKKLWNSDSSFVLTSGTMSDGNNFEYFKIENGLDRIGRYSLMETQTESPFNYSSNARLYIPDDIPYPDNDSEEYINAISERCYQLIEATNGHPLPFRKIKNRGEENQYYVSDTHEGIIDRATFDLAQKLLKTNQIKNSPKQSNNRYLLTGKIKCEECGHNYRRKLLRGVPHWICLNHMQNPKNCSSKYISEAKIYEKIITIINNINFRYSSILQETENNIVTAISILKRNNANIIRINASISELNSKALMLEQLRAKGYITNDIYYTQSNEITQSIEMLNIDKKSINDSILESALHDIRNLRKTLSTITSPLSKIDEPMFDKIIHSAIISNSEKLTITFIGGVSFSEFL